MKHDHFVYCAQCGNYTNDYDMRYLLHGKNLLHKAVASVCAKCQEISFANRLRAVRLAAGLGIGKLATKAGLAKQTVCNLEKGRREPAWETVCKLADALGVSIDQLRGK